MHINIYGVFTETVQNLHALLQEIEEVVWTTAQGYFNSDLNSTPDVVNYMYYDTLIQLRNYLCSI